VLLRDEVVMDQPIPFYKPNKNVSEKVMDHPIPKTKHPPHKVRSQRRKGTLTNVQFLGKCVAGNFSCHVLLIGRGCPSVVNI